VRRATATARPAAAASLALAVVLATGADGAAAGQPLSLQIVDHTRGQVVLTAPVSVGEEFVLDHVHSVHRTPVREVFSVNPAGEIALEEMRFQSTGANLPSGPETIGGVTTTFEHVDGGMRVLHHGRSLGSVGLLVGGPGVDHTITLPDGARTRLLDLADRGSRVELRVRGG
jgi:hypothetical protein